MGHADRDRGRRGASRSRGTRPGRRRVRAGRRGRRTGASRPCRCPHRRSRSDDRRGRTGHGRRRSRQHRVARAVGRRARDGLRRRIHTSLDGADDRLRGRGLVRAQGQGGAHPALACAARRLRLARLAQVAGSRGSVRRPRSRASPDQGPLPLLGGRAQGAPRLADRHRRHRQVAALVGVLQVLRRNRGHRVLAPRALPLLRRRRDVLGARRHGAHALPHLRGGGAGVCAVQAACHARGALPRRRRAELPRASPRAPARAGRAPGA